MKKIQRNEKLQNFYFPMQNLLFKHAVPLFQLRNYFPADMRDIV